MLVDPAGEVTDGGIGPQTSTMFWWLSLYHAINRDGKLMAVRLSDTQDLIEAEAFFRSAWTIARFCRAFDEVRAFLRPQLWRNQLFFLGQRRCIHQVRSVQLMRRLMAA